MCTGINFVIGKDLVKATDEVKVEASQKKAKVYTSYQGRSRMLRTKGKKIQMTRFLRDRWEVGRVGTDSGLLLAPLMRIGLVSAKGHMISVHSRVHTVRGHPRGESIHTEKGDKKHMVEQKGRHGDRMGGRCRDILRHGENYL